MAKTAIYCIRHPEVYNPRAIVYGKGDYDFSISEHGRKQVNLLGDQFRQRGIVPDVIVVSPQRRTGQTGTILANQFREANPYFFIDHRLQDVTAPTIEGRPLDDIDKMGDYYQALGQEIEQPGAIAARTVMSLREMRLQFGGKTIFAISHGDVWAFGLFALENPGQPLPSIIELEQSPYFLPRASAQKLVFDPQGLLLEKELIRHDDVPLVRKERGY